MRIAGGLVGRNLAQLAWATVGVIATESPSAEAAGRLRETAVASVSNKNFIKNCPPHGPVRAV